MIHIFNQLFESLKFSIKSCLSRLLSWKVDRILKVDFWDSQI